MSPSSGIRNILRHVYIFCSVLSLTVSIRAGKEACEDEVTVEVDAGSSMTFIQGSRESEPWRNSSNLTTNTSGNMSRMSKVARWLYAANYEADQNPNVSNGRALREKYQPSQKAMVELITTSSSRASRASSVISRHWATSAALLFVAHALCIMGLVLACKDRSREPAQEDPASPAGSSSGTDRLSQQRRKDLRQPEDVGLSSSSDEDEDMPRLPEVCEYSEAKHLAAIEALEAKHLAVIEEVGREVAQKKSCSLSYSTGTRSDAKPAKTSLHTYT